MINEENKADLVKKCLTSYLTIHEKSNYYILSTKNNTKIKTLLDDKLNDEEILDILIKKQKSR